MLINCGLRPSVKHSALVLKTSIASKYPRRHGSLCYASEGWGANGGSELLWADGHLLRALAPQSSCAIKWSGREDSNLRPLPPEDIALRLKRLIFVLCTPFAMLVNGGCCQFAHVKGSW